MSNISGEELFKDDLHLDSIHVKGVTASGSLFDGGNVTSEAISEAVDLSQLSKRMPWNIEESQAVDFTSKAHCPTSLNDVTREKSFVNSQKETKLLDILRIASRPTQGQDLLCHLCDLEVSFYLSTTVENCLSGGIDEGSAGTLRDRAQRLPSQDALCQQGGQL